MDKGALLEIIKFKYLFFTEEAEPDSDLNH